MSKRILVLAALAAVGFSGAAFAAEATTGSAPQTTGPAAMTDSQMDAVTAGAPGGNSANAGYGLNTATDAGASPNGAPPTNPGQGRSPVVDPGLGKSTAPGQQ